MEFLMGRISVNKTLKDEIQCMGIKIKKCVSAIKSTITVLILVNGKLHQFKFMNKNSE